MSLVPCVHTPLELALLPGVVAGGYVEAFGEEPSDLCRRMGIAQLLLEHGRRDRHPDGPLWGLWCWNLGNQDAVGDALLPSPEESPVALFRTLPEEEGHTSAKVIHTRRAFDSAEEGAAAYWRRLAEGYPEALAGMQAGSIEAFVSGLRARRYFTGSTSGYLATIGALVREAERRSW